MALHYQDKDEEIDRLAKDERMTPVFVLVLAVAAAIVGVSAFLTGKSLKSYGQDLAWFLGIAFVYWMLSPIYFEFRLRTKETNGKATAILERLGRLEERLDGRLSAIEDKLSAVEDRVDRLR